MSETSLPWRTLAKPRAWLAYGLTAVIVAAMVYAGGALPGVSVDAVKTVLHKFSGVVLLISFGTWSLQIVTSAVRLHVLLTDECRLSFRETWRAVSAGQCLNAFLPARIGDAAKLLLLGRRHRPAGFSIAGSLVADRVADLVALAVLVLCAGVPSFAALGSLGDVPRRHWLIVFLMAALGIVFMMFFWRRWRVRLASTAGKLAEGFRRLGRPGPLLIAVSVSLVGWICEATSLVILCRAAGFHLTLSDGVYLLFMLNLATAVPITVGQVGPFEAAIVYALATLNVAPAPALAVAVAHLVLYVGMLSFWAVATSAANRWRPATR